MRQAQSTVYCGFNAHLTRNLLAEASNKSVVKKFEDFTCVGDGGFHRLCTSCSSICPHASQNSDAPVRVKECLGGSRGKDSAVFVAFGPAGTLTLFVIVSSLSTLSTSTFCTRKPGTRRTLSMRSAMS